MSAATERMQRRNRTIAALFFLACGFALGQSPSTSAAATAAEVAKGPVVGPKPARMPDGKPNWTGFWVPMGGLLEVDHGLGGAPDQDLKEQGATGGVTQKLLAVDVKQLKPPYGDKLAKAQADAAAGRVEDPVALCFPPGMPRMMVMPYGMEILQTPNVVAITSEWQAASRRIWLNRKSAPAVGDIDATYTGYSTGRWEGDVLVVETVGVRPDVPVNYTGAPHSGRMRITERIHSPSPGILRDEITIDDDEAFVAPLLQVEVYRYRPDLQIQEYVCLENNRNVGTGGEAAFH